MIYPEPTLQPSPQTAPLRAAIDAHYRADETACVRALLDGLELDPRAVQRIEATARDLVTAVRGQRHRPGGIDAFLQEYGLSTQEGVMLMCIAEALSASPTTTPRNG
jgi:RHH-type transcriptional regulator, proline utilization regulon repressor / proline dehydrogenase / delta 1-pyrroline-5-carboxylate dehydrogenase